MRFEGILPAVTTPFDERDEIDVDALKANVEVMLEAGVHGFVATGTMGEAAGLTREERRTVVRAVVATVCVCAGGMISMMSVSPPCNASTAASASGCTARVSASMFGIMS